MKTKPIPESWHQFHRLVIIHSHNPKWSLNRCVAEAGCSARMPRIYLALAWIISRPTENKWATNVIVHLTSEMAEQIRAESKRMENASDPLGLNKPLAKPTGPTLTAVELAALSNRSPLGFLTAFTSEELVSELRHRGYEVTAKKTVEL